MVPMKTTPELTLTAMCRSAGLPEPETEYVFAPPRKFAFDFFWPCGKVGRGVALEIEGGVYGRGKACPLCGRKAVGAHTSVERLLADIEKYAEAAARGILVLRFTPGQVSDGVAMPFIERAIEVFK